jgi:Flp pilus assembly protein TadD/peroxiredoxin
MGLRALLLVLFVCTAGAMAQPSEERAVDRYRPPKTRVPPSLESVLQHLPAGGDAFPDEKEAEELAVRLAELGTRLRAHSGRAGLVVSEWLLAPEFKGSPLTQADEVPAGNSPQLEVVRARVTDAAATLNRAAFAKELTALVSDFASIQTAEFLITAIDVKRAPAGTSEAEAAALEARTSVRFDLAGAAKRGWRAERVGRWEMRWRRGGDGQWRVIEWRAVDQVRSRAAAPVFSEVTGAAFGGNASFRDQLVPGLDYWSSHLDAVFMPRGMGHHGVSAGDADGDGLDDLYVAQPEGLPNRLYRNRGNGTFEDITDAAGLAILDRTAQSLFADVENDGDQDLILLTRTGPLLFRNDGKARFTRERDAFTFEQPLQGSLTSAAMADYDRDGFLDLYLCAYGYFIGVSEDKAGPPSPYHDALNGSPNVLMRNDGHGRFVDVTRAVGLDAHNDRFSFAPAWADYDANGWPDLFVANDFGRKNLYRHDGMVNGQPRFTDVAAPAGVEDYGAGMSAAFLDYDNDGHLDIYAGNMWTAAGQRITAAAGFKPDASPEIKAIYRRHARGNSLFRNRGDGTFADVTLEAGAEFGRWAWASDAFDFDSDGWQDLYVVNGMFTRDAGEPGVDVDSFFWRQVVAQSPLERQPGTSYDDGWRATNRLLVSDGAQAQHERNVLLRNNGRGGFDDVSGSTGLDIDQDGRAFAVSDYDSDGDPDVVLVAPRSSPQLRLFRNDYAAGHASLALRLTGTKSNRDAIGARVTVDVEGDGRPIMRITRIVTAGSGFLSQHSKELLIGLGVTTMRTVKATIVWPNGLTQILPALPIGHRVWVEEGKDIVRTEPFQKASVPGSDSLSSAPVEPARRAKSGTWLYQPVPAPDFALRDLDGQEHSLSGMTGRPVLLSFWASSASSSRATLAELSRLRGPLTKAGATLLAISVDPVSDQANQAKVRAAVQGLGLTVAIAGDEVAGTWNILHRYLFDRREDLPLPTTFLINARGEIVKIYKGPIAGAAIVDDVTAAMKSDVSPADRLARAAPFPGVFTSQPGRRNEFQYGLELSEQEFDAPALVVFERVAQGDPSAIAFSNLGTLYMKGGRPSDAKAAFERALALDPKYADAHNTLGALLAQSGDLSGAITHFRSALDAKAQYPDAMNNLGYALFQMGQRQEAYDLYQRALALRPDFPEALNNVGIFYGQQRDLARAEPYFRQAFERRPTYGEAANNLALLLGARGDRAAAIAVLEQLLKDNPAFEPAYVTLCRMYVAAGQQREGLLVLERLLQRNPTHPQGLQMLKQLQPGR